jgi:hypothetical protein
MAKEVKDPKPKQGTNHNLTANEIKSVQVGSFILSPNKALLVSPPKVSSETNSLRWGDRAESEEGLPSPLPKSAPPRVDVSKKGEQKNLAKFACEARAKPAPVTTEKEQGPVVMAENCVLGDGVSAEFISIAALVEAANSSIVPAMAEISFDFPAAIAQSAGGSW